MSCISRRTITSRDVARERWQAVPDASDPRSHLGSRDPERLGRPDPDFNWIRSTEPSHGGPRLPKPAGGPDPPRRHSGRVIVIYRPEPGPFSDEHISLLQTFAEQAVIAIENVRLFKELEARTNELMQSV